MTAVDRLAWVAMAASLAVAGGCSSGSAGGTSGDGSAGNASSGDASSGDGSTDDGGVGDDVDSSAADAAPTYAPTFTAVYGEIIEPICAGPFCHASAQDDFLSMATKAEAYSSLVGVVSHGPKCGSTGLKLVQPGAPEMSLLYLKVTMPPCGNKMPPEYFPYLDSRQTGQISQWITLGALND
jgi:hypothetical protein